MEKENTQTEASSDAQETKKTLLVRSSELQRPKELVAFAEELRQLNSSTKNYSIKSIVDFHINEAEKEISEEHTKQHLMSASSLLDKI